MSHRIIARIGTKGKRTPGADADRKRSLRKKSRPMGLIRPKKAVAEHLEPSAFDKRNRPMYNPQRARLEYAGLPGTGDHQVS